MVRTTFWRIRAQRLFVHNWNLPFRALLGATSGVFSRVSTHTARVLTGMIIHDSESLSSQGSEESKECRGSADAAGKGRGGCSCALHARGVECAQSSYAWNIHGAATSNQQMSQRDMRSRRME